MRYGPHIEAEITFHSTKEGGRSSPAFSGYRPQFYYEGQDWDAQHEYPDVKQANPGDHVRAWLTFLSPEFHRGRVRPGTQFEIREGAKVVGKGTVTRLLSVEAEIRQLLYVASNYIDDATALSRHEDPEFVRMFAARTMHEFQDCFSQLRLTLNPSEARCVKIVAHASSAAVRLETILECQFNDYKDPTLGRNLGERYCKLLRHTVAHGESYVTNEKDAKAKQELKARTSKFILEELTTCFLKIKEYISQRELVDGTS